MAIVGIKRLHADAKLPKKAKPGDAAFDLYSVIDVTIPPGKTRKIPLGFASTFSEDIVGIIYDRSGMAALGQVVIGGVIDSGYRGEWQVIMYNTSDEFTMLPAGSRVAQVIFHKLPPIFGPNWVENLSESDRGSEGFGSTGV